MKSTKFSRHTFAGCLAALATVVFFSYSCHKNSSLNAADADGFSKKAADWFTDSVVAPEKKILALPFSVLAQNSNLRRFARMGRIDRILKWSDARSYNEAGMKYMVVPLDEKIKPFKNQKFEFFRDVVFYSSSSGPMKMAIIEVLSKENGSLGDDLDLIAHNTFRNRYLGQNEKMAGIDATVFFYGTNYTFDASFAVQGGIWGSTKAAIRTYRKSSLLPVPSVASIKDGSILATPMKTIAGGAGCGCQTTYTVGVTYDINSGEVLGVDILDESSDCGNIHAGEGDGGGGAPQPPDKDCLDACAQAASDLSNATTASDIVSTEITSIDALTKNYNPTWVCLKALTWALWSTEKGTVKLTDSQHNTWQWETLVHDKIALTGFPAGGVEVVQESGTASFTPGTPNVLYAGMQLIYTVKYTPICNCPIIKDVASFNIPYVSSCIFGAKPN